MKHLQFVLFALLLAACNSFEVKNAQQVDQLPQIYPDYTFVTVPSTIAPLNFQLQDSIVEAISVTFNGEKTKLTCSGEQSIDINVKKWHTLLAENVGDSIMVSVSALKKGKWLTYNQFPIYISPDSIDYALHYRLIAPGYGYFSPMDVVERNLSNFEVTTIYSDKQLVGGCMNCHTSKQCDTRYSSTHFRGAHGATVIRRGDSYKAYNLKPKADALPCVYSYWHPSGQYVAYSQNATRQVYFIADNQKIEVFDLESDVVVLDIENNKLLSSPLLQTKFFESSPTFAPNGKTMYFNTAAPCDTFEVNYSKVKYVLCSIAFDAETGEFGQTVDTLIDARSQDKSIAWAKPSYDGKFILYTLANYGQFSIWHPEADLWIYNLQTKESHPLEKANSTNTESYHNWSSNSRWIVFTSRRDDGYFSLPYLAHINEQGNADKAFLLPQRNPRNYYDQELKSYNMPDFALAPTQYDANLVESMLYSAERQVVSGDYIRGAQVDNKKLMEHN